MAPTPAGVLGAEWWYLLTSSAVLSSSETLSTYSSEDVLHDVQVAFYAVLTDGLASADKSSVTVTAAYTSTSSMTMAMTMAENPYAVSVAISAWCASSSSYDEVLAAMRGLTVDSHPLLPPLHEEGLWSIDSVLVTNVTHSSTLVPPPVPSDEGSDPQQITWIIVGTVAVFLLIAGLIYLLTYLRKPCMSMYDASATWCRGAYAELRFQTNGFLLGDEEDGGMEMASTSSRHSTLRHLNIHFRDSRYDGDKGKDKQQSSMEQGMGKGRAGTGSNPMHQQDDDMVEISLSGPGGRFPSSRKGYASLDYASSVHSNDSVGFEDSDNDGVI